MLHCACCSRFAAGVPNGAKVDYLDCRVLDALAAMRFARKVSEPMATDAIIRGNHRLGRRAVEYS
jgi:hypothetical protein